MKSVSLVVLLTSVLLCDPVVRAQEKSAVPEKLGKVVFSTSCDAKVQPSFERGVALLHSFWFQESEKTFREVLAKDPTCAIATWGIATVLIANTFGPGPTSDNAPQEAQSAIDRGRKIGAKTQRERDFVEAVASYYEDFANRPQRARMQSLAKAFESLAQRYPDDYEANAFYALYLASTQSETDKTYAATLKAAGILEQLFVKNPEHPGVAHYLIHSYDYPPIAEKGVSAAQRYAQIAPSAFHALHMPSHIFTRVGAWSDSVATNTRSAAVAKSENEPDSQLHATDYMVYAYLQLSRDDDARKTIAEAMAIGGVNQARSTGPYALAILPARYAIERSVWREAAQLQLRTSRFPYTEATTHFARALGAARSGDPAAAAKDLEQLIVLRDKLSAARIDYWANEVEVQRLAAAAWIAFAQGKKDEALALMRASADAEDKSEKNVVTPGRVVPARELLGEMLLEMKQSAAALQELEISQKHDPNRFRGLYGAAKAAELAGDQAKAKTYYQKLVVLAQNADTERPELKEAKAFLAKQ